MSCGRYLAALVERGELRDSPNWTCPTYRRVDYPHTLLRTDTKKEKDWPLPTKYMCTKHFKNDTSDTKKVFAVAGLMDNRQEMSFVGQLVDLLWPACRFVEYSYSYLRQNLYYNRIDAKSWVIAIITDSA